jgi:hypothetical protein
MGVSEKLLQIIVSGVIIFRHNWKGPTVLAVAGTSRHYDELINRRLELDQACIQVGLDYHVYQKEEKNTHTSHLDVYFSQICDRSLRGWLI